MTAVDVQVATLADLLAYYSQARRALTEYEIERAPIFEMHAILKSNVEEMQASITAAMAAAEIDLVEDDDFCLTLVRVDRGRYAVPKLPPIGPVWMEATLEISKAAVERLVKRGVLSREQAEAAWEPSPVRPHVRVAMKRGEGA